MEENKYVVVIYDQDFGRMGGLEGRMIFSLDTWQNIQGLQWYASDVLGKHSEVTGEIGEAPYWKATPLTEEDFQTVCRIFKFEPHLKPYDPKKDIYPHYIPVGGFSPVGYIQED